MKMSDFISKSRLLNTLATEVHYDTENPLEQYARMMNLINNAPLEDAEPVRHGLWNPKITALGTMVFKCSECQKYSDIHWAHCPYCGAKMDGERKEDAKTD